MADESIIANLKSEGFKELINDLGLSAKGFSLLDKSIEDAQKKLATLDKTSQEFKDLTKEINAATIAANAYSESSDSLKRELTETNNEIGKLERSLKALEKAGETNTKTYKDLAASQEALKTKSGELTNTVKSLNAEIKNSGSDTKNLDKALRAVNTVAAGYQAAQGALVLFGGENKKFEQTLLKLNAVMAITNGLQQIQNELSMQNL
jgi:chromosome segregation ATPase